MEAQSGCRERENAVEQICAADSTFSSTIFLLDDMSDLPLRVRLQLSLQRALWGAVYPQLRQAAIEADEHAHVIRVRFEYDGKPTDQVLDACQVAGTEVIADFTD